ncbi:MAG: DinB family protein [Bacteroidia bacterium]
MKRPNPTEYASYYDGYVKLVPHENILEVLNEQVIYLKSVLSSVEVNKESYRYAPDKWTIKEVVGHMVDTERIMAYRALCVARGEKNALPGYDDKEYVANANFNTTSLAALTNHFELVRAANLALFNTFDEEAFSKIGSANKSDISVRALLFIIAGHTLHHLNVINEKYLLT